MKSDPMDEHEEARLYAKESRHRATRKKKNGKVLNSPCVEREREGDVSNQQVVVARIQNLS